MKNRRACQSAPTCSHISPREHTLRLTSKTSPEAGTVSYTYNTDGTVATVTDAKSQQKTFTYDSYGRVTKIKAPGQSISYSYGSSYDGTNTLGGVATINYSVGSHTVQEGYNYTQAGDIAAKGVALDGYIPLNEGSLIATYLYDGEGHLTSVAYPVANTTTWGAPAAIYNYGLDSMGRLNTMTDQNNNTLVSGVTYSPANQILSLATSTFTETSTYNANLQLTTLVSGSYSYQYNYSANQNNGRVQSIQDNSSGEKVSYLYDSLNRMIQASGLYDPHGSWSQQFTYDGFGNLTQKIGTNAPNNLTINVDPTTNRLTGNGAVYDANGNLTQYTNTLANITFTYDSLNRLATATGWNGGSGNTANYGYDASNQRVYSNITVGGVTTETFFFYGVDGKKLGVWTIPPLSGSFTLVSLNTWFGGRLLKPQDRLNSIGKYFPYGEDRYSPSPANPPNGQEKFATYTRDAETGLDYAYQRYFSAGLGRFMTPDPYKAAAKSVDNPADPKTWNRYPYAGNDPINLSDRMGNCWATVEAGGTTRSEYFDCGVSVGDLSGAGGGSATGTRNIPLDPLPLTRQQQLAAIKLLARGVKTGLETDCQALADFIQAVTDPLEGSKSAPQQLKAAISALTPNQFPVPLIPGVTGNAGYVALNNGSSPSGFSSQFQDQIPNADQAHHFAAFFQLGFVYGASVSASAASWWEKLEGTAGNVGDINLGSVASLIGSYVASGVLPVDEVADAVRQALCK